MATTSRKPVLAPCIVCGQKTLHNFVTSKTKRYKDTCNDALAVLQCKVCGRLLLREVVRISDHAAYWEPFLADIPDDQMYDTMSGDLQHEVTRYYPAPITRSKPKWLFRFSGIVYNEELEELSALSNEVYTATRHDLRRLAIMGVRAVLDKAIISEKGDVAFSVKLKQAQCSSRISEEEFKQLTKVYGLGDAVIHRGYDPSAEDLEVALDVVEAYVQRSYVHPAQLEELTVPPRRVHPKNRAGSPPLRLVKSDEPCPNDRSSRD